MEYIISSIIAYKEDNPHVYITDDIIKNIIEENIELIIKEVKENI